MLLVADKNRLTLETLDRIPVPAAPRWVSGGTSHWRPVNHGHLARTVLREAASMGLSPVHQCWTTNPSRTDLFGSIDVESDDCRAPEGTRFSIGVRHSNAGRYAVSLVFGARVLVCSNGLLWGEVALARRHTTGLQLEPLVREGLQRFTESHEQLQGIVDRLQQTPLVPEQASHLMVEACRRDVLPWRSLPRVERVWREPPHEQFRPRTAWSLYNAFTEVAKGRSGRGQLRTLRGLRGLFSSGR